MSSPNPVFTDVVWNDVPKSWFDHSHKWEGTTDFSKLIPIYWDYFRPGDIVKGNVSIFGRSLPLKQPVYGDAYMHVDWFAVPLRLIWKNFTEFIQGTNNKGVPVSHVFPYVVSQGNAAYANDVDGHIRNNNGSLLDFLGGLTCWSVKDSTDQKYTSPSATYEEFCYDALPFRAYNAIWNEYFRDEQLQDVIDYGEDDGYDGATASNCTAILPVCAEKDRFTTARPNPQLGDAVGFSIDQGSGASNIQSGAKAVYALFNGAGGTGFGGLLANGQVASPIKLGTSVSELRTAVTLQRLLETRNVGGFRYFEQVLSDFGVKMSDIRAQRPEFIGGDTIPFMINSVTQSSSDTEASYLGEQAGQGMFSKDTDNFYYEANEDVIVMAVMFVRPRAFYFQNARKQLTLSIAGEPQITSWMDKFYNPKLQGLGDEPILNWEVAVGTTDSIADDGLHRINGIFGYTSQYSNWKCHPNEVHGEFKGSLRDWVYTRDCVIEHRLTGAHGASLEQLVQLHPYDYRHVYAYNVIDQDDYAWAEESINFSQNDHLLMDLSFGLEVRRSLEFYGTPGIGVI